MIVHWRLNCTPALAKHWRLNCTPALAKQGLESGLDSGLWILDSEL